MLTEASPPNNTGTPGADSARSRDQDHWPPAESGPAETTDASVAASPPLEIENPGSPVPASTDVPPEPWHIEPEYDATGATMEGPADTAIDAADVRLIGLDNSPGPSSDSSVGDDCHSATAFGLSADDETMAIEGEEGADDRLLDPDRRRKSSRQSNPVTSRMLREHFSDGKWRTLHDMAVRLDMQHIPDHVAAREVLDSPRIMREPLPVGIRIGQKRLIGRAMNAAMRSGDFVSRKVTHGTTVATEYRYRTHEEKLAATPTAAVAEDGSRAFGIAQGGLPREDGAADRTDERPVGDTGPVTANELAGPANPTNRKPRTKEGPAKRPADRKAEKGAEGRSTSRTSQQSEITKIRAEIRAEQQKIDRNEGNVIASWIAIGERLAALQAASGRTWGKQLEGLGYHPRVASRLQKLAKAWGGKIGRIASDLLPQLPADLNKIETLCRLDQEQLRDLLRNINCKKISRRDLVAEVRAALGEEPPTTKSGGSDDTLKAIERLLARLAERLEDLKGEAAGAVLGEQLKESLKNGIARLQESIVSS
jgi:hypothetical protein